MGSCRNGIETSLLGRVVIVTGSGQGIGRAFAKKFAGFGAIPVLADINQDKALEVTGEILEEGGRALPVRTDVADSGSVMSMVERVLKELGRIDVLINNAAVFSTLEMRPFDEIPLSEWDHVLRVNTTGAFLCSRAVVQTMREARWGRIIHISSAATRMGRPNYLHYIASKSALIGMARSMARELGPYGITVNAILPGATFTEIPRKTVTPKQKKAIIDSQCIGRAETPDDLVGTAIFLASTASSFLTGQTITVDGGSTHS
jgi:NAD(P)-dependent dehydrogenase (short-subunit alcohol dehydrogenase family)